MTVQVQRRLPPASSSVSIATKPDKPVLVNDVGTSFSHLVFSAWQKLLKLYKWSRNAEI